MKVVYLSGGVGGARLAHGMARALPASDLTLVVNTGDDLWHWGLRICPDLDTVMYTLADLAAVERGWGLADETFGALSFVERYGGESWFQLGDRDLGTHIMRSQWLREGASLSAVAARLCAGLGVRQAILPMSELPCETMIETDQGTLGFQRWLVHGRAQADVKRIWYRCDHGAERVPGAPAVLAALEAADLAVIGPSNPYVSIDPILGCKGIRERLERLPVIAVSPIVHGSAVKGPLARMLQTLGGAEASPASIAAHYRGLVRGLVGEHDDPLPHDELPCHAAHTVMTSREHSLRLAREVLTFAERVMARA
ncbi:MAG TPA: 2-phospho-L-lactate transferase [Polyangiales bacterium]|nr:2-phospho-L-lactate transferase [Polyangiales bacterium]